MDDKKAQFLPFNAINEFMRDDYRLEVIRSTLNALPDLPESFAAPINRLTRKIVSIPGFRNSIKASPAVKTKPVASAFEKNSELAAAVLSAWAEVHAALRSQVAELLVARGWEILPPEADRTKLPGFMIYWPDGEDFDVLNAAFEQMFPGANANSDDISLMTVWLSNRLPYQKEPPAGIED